MILQDKWTVERVRAYVTRIRRFQHKPEYAHALQDWLYERVLRAIAKGATSPESLAKEALEACPVDFPRWYA